MAAVKFIAVIGATLLAWLAWSHDPLWCIPLAIVIALVGVLFRPRSKWPRRD